MESKRRRRASARYAIAKAVDGASPQGTQASETTIPQDIAWRIFTKGIDRKTAETQVEVHCDCDLGLHVLGMVTIVG
jgi:hypothetical protein